MSKTVKDTINTKGRMRGYLATLTNEQRADLKAYRGPDGVKTIEVVEDKVAGPTKLAGPRPAGSR